jgi:type IV pilus assembly protein PilA
MYCPKCGTQNDDNAFRCVKCSAIIQELPLTSVPLKKDNTATILLVVLGGVVGVMIVIAIIGILAAIAIPQFAAYRARACNVEARTEIQQACNAASSFFMAHPDKIITLDEIKEAGVSMSPDIELFIEDGTKENLTLRAKHGKGNRAFIADHNCNIQEINP